jgi:hypothetical protein
VPAPEIAATTRIARRERVIAQGLLDETVILDPEAGTYLRLNRTGSWVWQRLDGPRTVEELAQGVAEEFGVDRSQARDDVSAFARDLVARELVELVG